MGGVIRRGAREEVGFVSSLTNVARRWSSANSCDGGLGLDTEEEAEAGEDSSDCLKAWWKPLVWESVRAKGEC